MSVCLAYECIATHDFNFCALCAVLLINYQSGNQIEKAEMDRECTMCRERTRVYRVLVGKVEGRRPLKEIQA